MTYANLNRSVIIPLKPGPKGEHRTQRGIVTAERAEVVRGRDRTILTIARPDGSTFDQDSRWTDFSPEFMDPAEALADLYLTEPR